MSGDPEQQSWRYIINRSVFSVLVKIGCLTFGVALGAILVGVWLDKLLGTSPWIMVVAFAASVPVTTFLIYQVVKSYAVILSSTPKQKSKEETHRE